MEKNYTVYMLKCKDGSYYIGITSDLIKRLWQHQNGYFKTCYTFKRQPVQLTYSGVFENVHDAITWEKRIKKWSRKKKEALFIGDRDRLIFLSKRSHLVSLIENIKRRSRKRIVYHNIFRDAKRLCHSEEL